MRKVRPSAVVTTAERASVAVIEATSTRTGRSFANVIPSTVTSTAPDFPISQQMLPDGALPPVMTSVPTARTGIQVTPRSMEYSMPVSTARQRRSPSAETISTGATASRPLFCNASAAGAARSSGGAAGGAGGRRRSCWFLCHEFAGLLFDGGRCAFALTTIFAFGECFGRGRRAILECALDFGGGRRILRRRLSYGVGFCLLLHFGIARGSNG